MAKRNFIRLLSFGLSVMMLVFSLPTAASELKETTMEALNEAPVAENTTPQTEPNPVEETVETVTDHFYWREVENASRSTTRDGYQTEHNSYKINSDIVPDGVYALRNWASGYGYLDIPNGSTEEGAYLFQNAQLGNYMQIDDDTAPEYDDSGAAMELFDFDGGAYQNFHLEHVQDAYYKIVTMCGKVVAVKGEFVDDTEENLWQAFYTGSDVQLWKFTKTSRGSYIIRPKSGEAYDEDFCMAAGDGIIITDGRNVEQRVYTANTDYKDEWYLHWNELPCWYSDDNIMLYWSSNPTVYVEDLSINQIFYLQEGVNSAIQQWDNVLPIELVETTQEYGANIACYGGTLTNLSAKGIKIPPGKTGICKYDDINIIDSFTVYYNGTAKIIHKVSGTAKIGIESAGHSLNTQKNVVVHEFGHALGYHGHSNIDADVMHESADEDYGLTSRDIEFLISIYEYANHPWVP